MEQRGGFDRACRAALVGIELEAHPPGSRVVTRVLRIQVQKIRLLIADEAGLQDDRGRFVLCSSSGKYVIERSG